MMYGRRIYYNAEQKAQMCDRWQKGESLNAYSNSMKPTKK